MRNTNGNKVLDKLFSVESLIIIFFIVLLLLGKGFTKYNIVGPIYLHDLSLGIITILALNRGKLKLRFLPLITLMVIACVYLAISVSFFGLKGPYLLMAFRHFNLFLYLICCYLIFNSLILTNGDLYKPISLIKLVAYLSVYLQVVYLLIGYMFIEGFSIFQPLDYNYFSPLTVMGIIVYGALVMAYEKNAAVRFGKFFFVTLLSTTVGHSSAFLALFVILLIYFFVRITPKQRIIAVIIAGGLILLLLFLPQFRDANAGWRLLYWRHILIESVKTKYLLFGSGFGKPFMTHDYAVYVHHVLGSPAMIEEYYPFASYLSPPHNSILTIVFHIGLIPTLLFFLPLKEPFKQLMVRSVSDDRVKNFLLYALVGCFIWISFNVILELPHSSTYFWLLYLTTAAYFKVSKVIT